MKFRARVLIRRLRLPYIGTNSNPIIIWNPKLPIVWVEEAISNL